MVGLLLIFNVKNIKVNNIHNILQCCALVLMFCFFSFWVCLVCHRIHITVVVSYQGAAEGDADEQQP